jgi:hypothetical protein
MRRHLSLFSLGLSVPSLILPSSLPPQLPDPPIRPAPSVVWVRPQRGSADVLPIGIEAAEQHDYTVLGLIIGAGVGFAAGWGLYNAICEAVDNDCADSRFPYLAIGTGAGGGLGALIGSLAD